VGRLSENIPKEACQLPGAFPQRERRSRGGAASFSRSLCLPLMCLQGGFSAAHLAPDSKLLLLALRGDFQQLPVGAVLTQGICLPLRKL
jgi:hypothetical protein